MGCAAGKEEITSRQAKFFKKTIDLCEQFNELKFEIIKSRMLLYQKFNIKNRIKSGSSDSKNSIETQICGGEQKIPNKELAKRIADAVPNLEDQYTTREQIYTIQSLPNYSQMVNIDEFIIIESQLEWKYLKETYTSFQNHKNPQKVYEMCKFFQTRMDEQILQLEEINKQSDILNKCIRAFKSEIKKKQTAKLYNDLNSILINSNKMIDQLKSSKANLSSLSLLTVVVDTSASLINCSPTPVS